MKESRFCWTRLLGQVTILFRKICYKIDPSKLTLSFRLLLIAGEKNVQTLDRQSSKRNRNVIMNRGSMCFIEIKTILLFLIVAVPAKADILDFTIADTSLAISGILVNGGIYPYTLPGSVLGLNITDQNGATSLSTTLGGSFEAEVDLNTGSPDIGSFQILSGNAIANNNGLYFPGVSGDSGAAAPANYGIVMTGEGTLFPTSFVNYLDISNFEMGLSSGVLGVFESIQTGLFDASQISYSITSGTVGIAYGSSTGPSKYISIAGSSVTNSLQGPGEYQITGNTYHARIPIIVNIPISPSLFDLSGVGNIPLSIQVTGTIYATATIPEVSSLSILASFGVVFCCVWGIKTRLASLRAKSCG